MKREVFQLGPEALKFQRADVPIVDQTLAVMRAHLDRIAAIEAAFFDAIKEAREHAEWSYRQACQDAAGELAALQEAAQ